MVVAVNGRAAKGKCGSIVSLRLKNFLTYANVDITPGPNLNIVIGPNGSGKSSLICAIALGLGGKPLSLGRSKHLQHYIKKGEKSAEIIVKLISHDSSIVELKRIIFIDKGSDWFMNGKSVTQTDVIRLVHSLNIRVDNLCQFLPQDKVNQFSKMSPEELLRSTEQAMGQIEIYENHMQLTELSKKVALFDSEYQAEKNRLEYKQQGVDRISRDVERLQEAKRNKDTLKLLYIKQAWVSYNQQAESFKQMKAQKTKLTEEIAKLKEEIAPYSSSNKEKLKNLQESYQKARGGVKTYATQVKKVQSNDENLRSFRESISEIQSDFKSRKDDERNRRLNAEHLMKIIEESEQRLAQLNDTDFKDQIQQIQQNITEKQKQNYNTRHEISQIQQTIDQLNVERNAIKMELNKLNDIENQKIEKMRREDPDVIRAMDWIAKNKDKLPGKVEGPVALCLKMKDKAAQYVENVVRKMDLKIFVCSNNETAKMITNQMRFELNLRVNIAVVPGHYEMNPIELDRYRHYGFYQRLSELIDGPSMVMKFLYSIYHFEQTLMATEQAMPHVDEFLDDAGEGVYKFFVGPLAYTTKKSKYGNRTRSTTSYEMRPANLLGQSINDEHKNQLTQQISDLSQKTESARENLASKNQISKKFEEEIREYKNRKSTIENSMQEMSTLRNRIQIQQDKLKSIESKKTSIDDIKVKMNAKIEKVYGEASKKFIQHSKAFGVMNETIKGLLKNALEYIKVNNSIKEVDDKHAELNSQLVRQTEDLRTIDSELSTSKQRCSVYRSKAMELSGIRSGQQIGENLKNQLQQLPDEMDKIEEQIHNLNARTRLNANADERLIHDYHKEKEEISNIQKSLEESQKEINQLNQKLLMLKTVWIKDMNEIVSKISKNFSDYLERLGYTGEVLFYSPDNENNFSEYGIRIMVKYRDNESLQLLDSHHQSGGERSVATILYMLALQNLTSVPFRCVDEINQGMDPVNERKVFNMIVDKACESSQSQYFLLTPKLLKGLNYHKNLSVLSIYPKGPVTEDWELQNFSQGIARESELTQVAN